MLQRLQPSKSWDYQGESKGICCKIEASCQNNEVDEEELCRILQQASDVVTVCIDPTERWAILQPNQNVYRLRFQKPWHHQGIDGSLEKTWSP